MTQQAINQLLDRAKNHQDVTAEALLGLLYCEGSLVEKDMQTGMAWLKCAAQCNCLFAKELLTQLQNPSQQHSFAGSADSKPQTDSMAELNGLIGLSRVKSEVESLRNLIKIQAMRAQQGLPNTNMSYHVVFTGNPGTGKTTVARIIAGIYKELGILKKGHLVETDRSGLVAEYVGQTAPKTNAKIDEALDGVLFIDEAYTLVAGGESDYGSEAIATLLKRMEDDRDRLVVILAGYTQEIQEFIDSNPGLQSRFNRYIQFDDYSADELCEILKSNLKKSRYQIKRDAYEYARGYIEQKLMMRDEKFGNARFVRNMFEKIVQNQADRLARMESINNEDLRIIVLEDVQKLK